MGRPSELTPEMHALIIADIEDGNAGEVAAMANGIERTTFYRWMQQGITDEGIYRDFRAAVRRARAEAEKRAVKVITSQMAADPKLAVEYLRRARWKRWEPKQRTEVKLTAEKMTDQEIDAAIEAHQAARLARGSK